MPAPHSFPFLSFRCLFLISTFNTRSQYTSISQPLTFTMSDFNAGFADDASQASRSSLSGSLLDRIRAQREREMPVSGGAQPEPLTVPNYAPVETTADTSNGWSMNMNLPRFGGGNTEATTSLLGEEEGGEGYSMTGYFQTFVQDVYNAFRSVHPVAQGVIVVVLVMVAFRLLFF